MTPEDAVTTLHRKHDTDIHLLERKLDRLENKIDANCKEMQDVEARLQAAAEHLAWTAQSRRDLQELVDAKHWATVTRQVIAWGVGALIGAVMLWEYISPRLKSLANKAP